MKDGPLARRELFGAAASSLMGLLGACAPAAARTEVIRTPEGKVLQWERDDLLVLVSGLEDRYRPSDQVHLRIMLNNQTTRPGLYRVRTRVVGRGEQVFQQAVDSVQVGPLDAAQVERDLSLTSVEPGDYTLVVELPPWSIDGRTVGGGTLSAPLRLDR